MAAYLISLSLLIAAVLLIRVIFRKTVSPRAIYALWLAVAVRMCLPFALVEVNWEIPAFRQQNREAAIETTSETAGTTGELSIDPNRNPPQTAPILPVMPETTEQLPVQSVIPTAPENSGAEPADTPDAAVIAGRIWCIGSVAAALWFGITGTVFHIRLCRDRRLYKTMHGTKVYISSGAGVPCIAGLLPSIYITPETAGSRAEKLILRHEYTHLRHGDPFWSIVRTLALIIHWWNPLVWIAARVSRQDAELACDDTVVSMLNGDQRLEYARILLDTIPRKHKHSIGLGSAPMKERLLLLTRGQKNRWICLVLAIVLTVSAAGCSFLGQPRLTMDNIQAQNGFTILSQETKEITLALPLEQLPPYDAIVSSEGARLELEDITVFTTDTTEVFLHTVGVSGHEPESVEKDVLYLGFDIRHTLTETGTVYTVNRVMNEDGLLTYTAAFQVTEATLQKYDHGIREMGNGPIDNFYLYIDAALYAELRDNLKIGITLNEIQYERGTEVKVYGKEKIQSSEHDIAETLKIPEISLTQVNELPRSEAAALFSASPVGGNPTIYFFENDLSFYIRRYTSVDAECVYYSGSLTLPEGFSGGRVVRASGGGGSGETFITVCAEQDGRTVYLDYFINYNNEPFLPDFVYVLDDQQITELREAMNNMPIHRDIYLCDDVYRSADTPTHGSAEVFIPIALTDYSITDCQILLCEDGCDPTNVVSRAFWGYGPAWRIDQYEEYTPADGWRFPTRRYINEVPEEIRAQMRDQGAPDSVIWPREYLYLVTLEPGKYAFIVIEPNEPDGEKPTDEIQQVNGFIQNMEVIVEVPVSEEELAEEIIMPVEEVVEETAEAIIEGSNPDWLVDEDSEPYTYTREEWIRYSLYTDFGFRDPVDVSALTDDELTAYMADAYQCALDIYFLFEVCSDRMYARNLWNSTMPHVEIDGRHYSQMFNPVFPTLADLESYMNGVLSPTLTKQLLAMEIFIDYEGELWGMMGARGTDISKKTVGFSVTSRSDTEIIYTAEVEVREYDLSAEEPDYVEYHNFTYALTEDGWRWTDFYLYS